MQYILSSAGAYPQKYALMPYVFLIGGLFGSELVTASLSKGNQPAVEGSKSDSLIWRFPIIPS